MKRCLESNVEQSGAPSGRSCSPGRRAFSATRASCIAPRKKSVDTALKYAFVGRRNKKRDFRRLWVVRINAAARENGLTYGQLINGLKTGRHRRSIARCSPISP